MHNFMPFVIIRQGIGNLQPFVMLQALGLGLVMMFPKIALWLPSMMPY